MKISLKSKIGEALELIENLNRKLPKIVASDEKEVKKEGKKKERKLSVQEEMVELQKKLMDLRKEM